MPEYFYKNKLVPESQLLRLAEEDGMSLEEFLESNPGITTEDVSVEEEPSKAISVIDTPSEEEPSEKEIHEKTKEIETGFFEKAKDVIKAPFVVEWEKTAEGKLDLSKPSGYAKLQYQRKKEEAIRQSDKDYIAQKTDLSKELDKAFGENPTLFGNLVKNNEEVSLQDRDIKAGDYGNPEEYLKDLLKQELGGFGWFGGDRKGIESEELGLTTYNKLTNEDIDKMLISKFDTKLTEEKTNVGIERSNEKISDLQEKQIPLETFFQNKRTWDISLLHTKERPLANLIEKYNHGTLEEDETKESVWNQIIEEKEKLGKDPTKMLMNLQTGMLTFVSDQKAADEKLKDENLALLDIEGKQKEFDKLIGIYGDPQTALDVLKQEYQRSALAMGTLNKELNEVVPWTGKNYNMQTRTMMKASGAMRIKDLLRFETTRKPDKYSQEEWDIVRERWKQDRMEYTADHEALKRMYLLNEGVQDIDISAAQHLKTSLASFITPFTGKYEANVFIGSTERKVLDKIGAKSNELGFELSPEDEKYLERTTGEQINEALTGSGRILLEFYGINKIIKPVQAVTGFNKFMGYLGSARWGKHGKTFTEYGMKAKVAAKTGKDIKKVTQADVFNYATNLGMKPIGKHGLNNVASYMLTGGLEGAKFEAITRFDTGGEESGFWTGFGFGIGGRAMAPLAPYLSKKGMLKDFDLKPIHLNTRKMFETFVSQPASFVAGSEFGETMNAIVDDALGNKDLQIYMDEHYKDFGTIGQRMLVNHAVGIGFGQINRHGALFKGFGDFKSKVAIENNIRTAKIKLNESARLAGVTDKMVGESEGGFWGENIQKQIHEGLSNKNLAEYYKNWEVYSAMRQRLTGLHRAEGYMDPSRADEIIKDEMKFEIERQRKQGVNVQVEVVNNKALKKGQERLDVDADVVTKDGGKTKIYRFNAERYTPDIKAHEVSHDYFEGMFSKDAIFKSDFMRNLGGIAKKIELPNRIITDKDAIKLGGGVLSREAMDAMIGKPMTLEQSLRLEKFDPSNPINNMRITQWEMFSHIAQQLGNKKNYYSVTGVNGFGELRGLISNFGKKGGQKYNLSTEGDVVRWFRDYSSSVKKGRDVTPLFEELSTVIDIEATRIQKQRMAELGRTGPDTYQTKPLDLGGGRKINDPKKLADDVQKEYKAAIAGDKSKLDFYKELSDPNTTSPNYSKDYPVLGKKLGPIFDVALSSWNKAVGERFEIKLSDRSWESKRSALAMDFRADPRGFENIFETYEPIDTREFIKQEGKEVPNPRFGKPQKLMTWVVGQSRLRMQEIIERGVGKITEVRETKVGEWTEFERVFEDVDAVGGKVDKSFDELNPNVKPKGIQLKDYKFNFEGGRERTMDPKSVEDIKTESKKVFYESTLKENTGVQIGKKLESVTDVAMNEMIGVKEGMKPKEIDAIQSAFFGRNKAISYDAGLELTSNPNFYENTNAAKSIFNFAHKNTGVKYKTAEMTVEEARRTDARAYKYKKLPATTERVDKVQEIINSGRDAGVRVAKQNVLKKGIGKHFGNQLYRESLVELKEEIDTNLRKAKTEKDKKYWSEQKAKLEGINAELAMRRLRGATPERLQAKDLDAKDLDTMDRFIEEWKGLNHAKLLHPEIRLRTMIENNAVYRELFDTRLKVVDEIAKDMGYKMTDLSHKVWQKYAEANRLLEKTNHKVLKPELFDNWTDKTLINEIEKLLKGADPNNLLNIGEKSWYKNWDSVKEFDSLVDWMKNNMSIEIFDSQMMKRSVGIGLGKVKFAKKDGSFETRNNTYWNNLMKGVKGSGKKAPEWVKHYKTTDNARFKENLNIELGKWYSNPKTADLKTNPKTQKAFAKHINEKYLIRKGSSFEKMVDANEKMLKHVYSKLFDYYKSSKNKPLAINNIFRLLQQQASIGGGFTRSLATHNAVTLNFVKDWRGAIKDKKGNIIKPTTKTHSEHEFQAFNFNANFILNMIKNSGNKTDFLNNFKPLSRIFKQSIIDRSIQEKYDSAAYGGKTGLPKGYTTESGKYPFMREMEIAETTLDLKTGKTYDRLLTDLIISGKALKAIEKINNKLFKNIGLSSKNLSSTEKIIGAKNIDKALAKARILKKEKKGMSAWDFDDTIARTKSGVLATIPNISGKPMPGRKVIFMAGGPGSGKSSVIKSLGLKKDGFKIVNQDISLQWLGKNHGMPKDMREFTAEQRSKWGELTWEAREIAQRKQMKFQGKGDGIIVDGTGQSKISMEQQVMEFKNKGYDVSMLFVEAPLEVSIARNKARKERSLKTSIVERTWNNVMKNKESYRKTFGENFTEVNTGKLKLGDALPKDVIFKSDRFTKSYEKRRLTAEEFANRGKEILDQGGKFDFSEFEMVREGEPGPFFEKFTKRMEKYGPKDNFILTARPPESAPHIQQWLRMEGYEIPLENIKALGNSTAEAKALWMLEKASEGYNDFYFADDAIKNVKEVKNVLEQLDVKSKVQQALASKNLDLNVNDIMEHSLDIESKKVFSKAEGKVRGKDIKRRRIFLSDSAGDLELLIEPLYGKGDKGIKNKKWFKKEFIEPFERGIRDYNTARQTAKNDYIGLRKQNKDVVKKLNKPVEGTNFTHDMAMRVYLWNKAGFKIPDLTKTTETKLVDYIKSNPKLQAYAETFAKITKLEKGLKEPSAEWWGETMAGEVTNIGRGVSRKQYLQEFIDVKNEIFSEKNFNKMESKLGTRWRENIEDMFDRMETGRTRSLTMDRGSAMMMNYLNGSVGTIMNFNTRSAALQTISTLNFLNMRENNPIAAARAMGNVPQFSKDFMRILNSDMLKQRRDGLEINVTEAEIASAAIGSKNPIQSIIAKVLKVGYLPTKLADSFAISFGGATFYRNRIKMYEKQGFSKKEAESKGWLDFQALSERTQQSSRPDLLSRQQTSLIGRFILPFANTPLQMNRAGAKDILDISKGRYKGARELSEKMGRITYYMGAQIAIFAGLQSALFAMLLNDDDVSEEKIQKTKTYALNTTSDSFLRGMGIQGAVISAFKNATLAYMKESKKDWGADYSEVGEALLNISPPIGSKFSKLDQAGNIMKYDKDVPFKFELGNPKLEAATLTVEALFNVPTNRAYKKSNNIMHSLNTDYENWQRAYMMSGYTPWNVGIELEKKKTKKKKKFKQKEFEKKFEQKTF